MTATVDTICSCGDHADHEIARRRTADDKPLEFWSSGEITSRGTCLRGIGRARSKVERGKRRQAAMVIADMAWLLESREVVEAYGIALAIITKDRRGRLEFSVWRISNAVFLALSERRGFA